MEWALSQQDHVGRCRPSVRDKGRLRYGEITIKEAGLMDGVSDTDLLSEFVPSRSEPTPRRTTRATRSQPVYKRVSFRRLQISCRSSEPQQPASSHHITGSFIVGLGSDSSGTPEISDQMQGVPECAPGRGMRSPLSWAQMAGSQVVRPESGFSGIPKNIDFPVEIPEQDQIRGKFDVQVVPTGISSMPHDPESRKCLPSIERVNFEKVFQSPILESCDFDDTKHGQCILDSTTELKNAGHVLGNDVDAVVPTITYSQLGMERKLARDWAANMTQVDSDSCEASASKTSKQLPVGMAEGQQEAQSSKVDDGIQPFKPRSRRRSGSSRKSANGSLFTSETELGVELTRQIAFHVSH